MENWEKLFADNPAPYRAELARTQHNLGSLYSDLHDYANSERYYKLALENYEKLFADNPAPYRADLAGTQNNLGLLYSDLHDYANSERYYKMALENYEKLFIDNPAPYRAYLAECLNSTAYMHANASDYTKAINTIDEAIAMKPEEANSYDTKGEILLMQGKEQEALKMWQKVLELNPKFLDDYPEGTNLSNGLKARGLIK